jgi:hypothetical protein
MVQLVGRLKQENYLNPAVQGQPGKYSETPSSTIEEREIVNTFFI